ncbi:MAG: PLP-dependent aminotransferase family protein [Ottowia sp.]|nr:PLP-dependent aminotransferase family protein [Ottowia sp.]
MQLPLVVRKTAKRSLQEQIADQIRDLIVDGRLAPGFKLPASRELARDLGLSRNTVVAAFGRLAAEGLVESREPTGTFVAHAVPAEGPMHNACKLRPDGPKTKARLQFRGKSHVVVAPHGGQLQFDFWVGRPDARFFPLRIWRDLLCRMLRNASTSLSNYGDPQGLLALREAIAAHVGSTRAIATSADRIVITNGIQEGLNLLATLLIAPGVKVAVENPCYRGAAQVFESCGASLQPIALDASGLNTARLPRSAALVYVTPSHQYPLGMTLPLTRREQLLAWASKSGCYIAEDDYDNDFFYDGTPLPALKSMDQHGQVVYLGTFSKSLGAGLRIGYMVLPPELCEPARNAKALLNNCQPWLEQAALATFISEGGYAAHLRRLRQLYAARCQHLRAGLAYFFPDWQVDGAGSGMHLVVRLPDDGPNGHMVETMAQAHGIGVYAVKSGNARLWNQQTQDALQHTLLLGYASLNEAQISSALLRLRRALRTGRAPAAVPA